MTILRYVLKAALCAAVVCSIILLLRYRTAKRMQSATARAEAKGYAPAPGHPDKTVPVPLIPALAQLTDALPDLLWMEEGMVKGSREIPIMVDPSVKRVLFAAIGATSKPKLILGAPPHPASAPPSTIKNVEVPKGAWVSIERPDPGTWTVRVEAKDTVTISVRAKTTVGLEPIQVMRPKADGTLENYSSVLEGGEAELLSVGFSGDTPPTEFVLIGRESLRLVDLGAPVEEKRTTLPGRMAPVWQMLFRLPIPDVSFRLLVRGVDSKGRPFQRVSQALLDPEPVRGLEQLNFIAKSMSQEECRRVQDLTPILLPDAAPAARASLLCIRDQNMRPPESRGRSLRLRLFYPPSSDRLHPQNFKLSSAPYRRYTVSECRELMGFFERLPKVSQDEFAEGRWSASCQNGQFALDVELAALVH